MLMPLLHYWWRRPDATQWVWIGLGVGLFALVGTAVTILAQKWGHPRLRIDYISYASRTHETVLAVSVFNDVVKSGILRWLGVYSRTVTITPAVRILREPSLAFVGYVAPFPPHAPDRPSLSESVYPISFAVVALRDGASVAVMQNSDVGNEVMLPAGSYAIQVDVEAGQHSYHEKGKRFVVGERSVYWAESEVVNL